jgi:hypothetical protein
MMPNPHIKKQLHQVKNYHNHSWSHFWQLGKLINYHEDGIHSIPLGQLGHEVHGNTFPWLQKDR